MKKTTPPLIALHRQWLAPTLPLMIFSWNHTQLAYCHPFQIVSKQPNPKFVAISLNLNPHETSPHVNASNQQINFVASTSLKPTFFCTNFKSKKPMQKAQQKFFYL